MATASLEQDGYADVGWPLSTAATLKPDAASTTVAKPRLDADTTRLAMSISCLGLSSTLWRLDPLSVFQLCNQTPIQHFTLL